MSQAGILKPVVEQLLTEVRREKSENGELSDDLLSALYAVFQQPLLNALDIIDRESVTRCVCPTGRELYQVQGSGSKVYICLTTSNYCSCPSFVYSTIIKEDSILCKHQLAVHLAGAMQCYKKIEVSDEEFAKLLSEVNTNI